MPDSTSNHPGVEVGRHPQWCDRDECQTTADGEVCHRSTPQRLEFRDCTATIHLQAWDDTGQPWHVEATVRIIPALTWPDGTCDLYLNSGEMLQLQDRIATERQRIQLLSGPVLRPAVTA